MGKRLAVILGAGASHDVVKVPVTRVENDYRPPLADELFQYRKPFAVILDKYPRARALAATIVARVSQGESVENVLREVRDSGQDHLLRQFRQVPLYLQELFHTISIQYTTEPANYTHLMNSVLGSDFDKVAFVTLNYDLLLENSLTGIGEWRLGHIDQYVTAKGNWMLIKLHGSANWGRRVLNPPLKVPDHEHVLALVDELLVEETELGEIETFRHRRWVTPPEGGFRLIYPWLTVPVAGKYEYACPEKHVRALEEFLTTCENFLIIGISGRDQDLLDLLAQNVKHATQVMIVGDGKVEEAAARFGRQVPAFSQAYRSLRHPEGFSHFMKHELKGFLNNLS